MVLTDAVIKNNGYVKYKSIPLRECSVDDLKRFCMELSIDYETVKEIFFKSSAASQKTLY